MNLKIFKRIDRQSSKKKYNFMYGENPEATEY